MLMNTVVIIFDKKSLLIQNDEFNIFKNENYYVDDELIHVFYEPENCFMVVDKEYTPLKVVKFKEVLLENKKYYEIELIRSTINETINPEENLEQARGNVKDIIYEIFELLYSILEKRVASKVEMFWLFHKYYIFNKIDNKYDITFTFDDKCKYSSFISKLDYCFYLE